MEQILDLYEEPYDPKRAVVCFDERPCQLCWTRCESPLPASPASQSVSTVSMSEGVWPERAPGLRTPQGPKRDESERTPPKAGVLAAMMRYLLEDLYPEVERIHLVVENLNTHSSPAAFYESFCAQEARRMSKKIEFLYTPRHGSWLNMVEIELSVLW